MIISIDTQIVFDKIQHPFIIQIENTLGIKGKFLYLIQDIYKICSANVNLVVSHKIGQGKEIHPHYFYSTFNRGFTQCKKVNK